MGITVLPPDVNAERLDFTPDGEQAIRFGLGAMKNVGQSAVEAIRAARAEVGAFSRPSHEFCEKVDLSAVNRRMIESLIKAGAMDSLEGTRSQQFAAVDGAMEPGQRVWKDRAERAGLGGRRDAAAAETLAACLGFFLTVRLWVMRCCLAMPHLPGECRSPTVANRPNRVKWTPCSPATVGHPANFFPASSNLYITPGARRTSGPSAGRWCAAAGAVYWSYRPFQ